MLRRDIVEPVVSLRSLRSRTRPGRRISKIQSRSVYWPVHSRLSAAHAEVVCLCSPWWGSGVLDCVTIFGVFAGSLGLTIYTRVNIL